MSFPAGLTMVTVACRFDLPPAGGASGTVRFTSRGALVGATDDSIVAPFTVTATLDANGVASVLLPATNDPQWVPLNWSYAVYAVIGSATIRGTLQLDYQASSVQLADFFQVDGTATAGVTYATLAQLTTVSNTVTANAATATTGIAAAAAGYVKASDQNLVGWTFDPSAIQAGTVLPTAGLANVARVRVLSGAVTNIHFHFTAGGGSLTAGQCFAALYNDAGALLGAGAITGDQAGNWATSGFKTCALSVAQGVTPNAWYRVLFWFNGTTGPTISRGANSDATTLNAGLSAPLLRYSSADTGRTNAASVPANIGTQTATQTAWWVGLS